MLPCDRVVGDAAHLQAHTRRLLLPLLAVMHTGISRVLLQSRAKRLQSPLPVVMLAVVARLIMTGPVRSVAVSAGDTVAPLISTLPQEVRPQLEAFITTVFKVSGLITLHSCSQLWLPRHRSPSVSLPTQIYLDIHVTLLASNPPSSLS